MEHREVRRRPRLHNAGMHHLPIRHPVPDIVPAGPLRQPPSVERAVPPQAVPVNPGGIPDAALHVRARLRRTQVGGHPEQINVGVHPEETEQLGQPPGWHQRVIIDLREDIYAGRTVILEVDVDGRDGAAEGGGEELDRYERRRESILLLQPFPRAVRRPVIRQDELRDRLPRGIREQGTEGMLGVDESVEADVEEVDLAAQWYRRLGTPPSIRARR